jgi:restriction system protein
MVNWGRNHLRTRGLLVDEYRRWSVVPAAKDALTDDLSQRGATATERLNQFISSSVPIPDLLGPNWAGTVRGSASKGPKSPSVAALSNPPTAVASREAALPEPQRPPQAGDAQGVQARLIERLNKLEGYEFEQLVARILDALGFRDTQVVGRSGDEGIDLITYLHSPLIRAKVVVQVKRHTANVGPKDVSYLRDRWSHRADRLMFVTTSDFTAGAREVASEERDKPVELVSGAQLIDVMMEHRIGVLARPVLTYEIDEEFFSGI